MSSLCHPRDLCVQARRSLEVQMQKRNFGFPLFSAHRGAYSSHFKVQNDWTQKMWYLHTAECHSALRKAATLLLGAVWMDLEIIVPREMGQTEKTGNHMLSLICGMYNRKLQLNKTNQNPQTWTTV